MKKLLLVIFCSISTILFGQTVPVTVDPEVACPNVTHDVVVSATNNTGFSIPAGLTYTIDININSDAPAVLKNFNQSYSDGFSNGTGKTITITDVPFEGPMTCTITGKVYGTFPIVGYTEYLINQTYLVDFPYTLTIAEVSGNLEVTVPIDGLGAYTAQYYLDGNPTGSESSDGVFTPTADGDYTAKAIAHVTSTTNGDLTCSSASASNTVTITINAIEESQNISISVYPNPVVSSVTIAAGVSSELTYELSDMNGAIVRSSSFNSVGTVNAEDLKAGSYILTIKNRNEKIASYKLIK